MSDIVSVIIPSYNRFKYLLNAIESVKTQTYTNFEIIVVNDASTQNEYYSYDWDGNGIKIIHMPKNSKSVVGFASPSAQRNAGIYASIGKYVAFLDDDDIWLPKKLEFQVKAMAETGCKMSSTEGLHGKGVFNSQVKYQKYNSEKHFSELAGIYSNTRYNLGICGCFPKIWNLEFIKIHNCMICSSVVIEKDICSKVGEFKFSKNRDEDYDYWMRCLEYTNSAYVEEPCFYYDGGHGDGINY